MIIQKLTRADHADDRFTVEIFCSDAVDDAVVEIVQNEKSDGAGGGPVRSGHLVLRA